MRRSVEVSNSKRKWIIGAAVGVVVLAVAIFLIAQLGGQKNDPYRQTETVNKTPDPTDTTEPTDDKPVPTDTDTDKEPVAELDPATVSTIDIAPLGVTASYVKGVGGFEYAVQRTPSGTRYVQFSNEELVGTKCTDDSGPFASILVNPSSDESATLAKKVTVDGTVYGLSLAAVTCTSNVDLLKQYQASFTSAFHLLKTTPAN